MRGVICEAGTLPRAGGGTEAVEGRGFWKDVGSWSRNRVLDREFLLGVWEGKVFQEQGLDGSQGIGLGVW